MKLSESSNVTRREFVRGAAIAGAALCGVSSAGAAAKPNAKNAWKMKLAMSSDQPAYLFWVSIPF